MRTVAVLPAAPAGPYFKPLQQMVYHRVMQNPPLPMLPNTLVAQKTVVTPVKTLGPTQVEASADPSAFLPLKGLHKESGCLRHLDSLWTFFLQSLVALCQFRCWDQKPVMIQRPLNPVDTTKLQIKPLPQQTTPTAFLPLKRLHKESGCLWHLDSLWTFLQSLVALCQFLGVEILWHFYTFLYLQSFLYFVWRLWGVFRVRPMVCLGSTEGWRSMRRSGLDTLWWYFFASIAPTERLNMRILVLLEFFFLFQPQ